MGKKEKKKAYPLQSGVNEKLPVTQHVCTFELFKEVMAIKKQR